MTTTLRFDLHVHSSYSADSRLPLEQIAQGLGAAGLHGFAITDHNTVDGHGRIPQLRDRSPHALIIPGVEYSAHEGHVLLYGVADCPPRHRPLAEVAEWAEARNAVVVLAHPFRWVHGAGRRVAESGRVHGIEVQNGRNSEVANTKAAFVAARRHVAATGGSDAHELRSLGRAYTEFPEAPETVEDLLEALRRGKCEPGGASLSAVGRLRLLLRNGTKRAGRRFRSV
jgi:predicted metal-dependent phosphoesterase TrpH